MSEQEVRELLKSTFLQVSKQIADHASKIEERDINTTELRIALKSIAAVFAVQAKVVL